MSPAGVARPVTSAVPGAHSSDGDLRRGQQRLPTIVHSRLADPEEDAGVAVAPVDEVIAAVARSLPVRAPEAVVALPAHCRFVEVAFLALGDRGAPDAAVGRPRCVVGSPVTTQGGQ